MDVVFEGALSKSWGMKDVLQAIHELPNVQLGLLRISCSSKSIQGKILFTRARHILGASCTEGLLSDEPYDALKELLEVKEGNFAFMDISGEVLSDIDQSLFIDISRVIDCLPELPAHSSELFDQSGLLDRVFGQTCDAMPQQQQPAPVASEAVAAAGTVTISPRQLKRSSREPVAVKTSKTAAAPITQWNVVESLFENPQAAHTEHAECPVKGGGMIPQFVQTADEQRSSMTRLRSLPESSSEPAQWQKIIKEQPPVKWLLAALGLSTLMFLFAMQMPNSNAPEPNQRVALSSSQSAH